MNLLVPPLRYGVVEPGLFRGSYPTIRNFRFLRRLQLKSIITCTPEPPTKDLLDFCRLFNIQHHYFEIKKQTEELSIELPLIMDILQVYTDPLQRPCLLHCLDGARTTGITIACLRKLQQWSMESIISELQRYERSGDVTSAEIEYLHKFNCDDIIPWLQEGRVVGGHALCIQSKPVKITATTEQDPMHTRKSQSSGIARPHPGALIMGKKLDNEETKKVECPRSVNALALEGMDELFEKQRKYVAAVAP